MKALWNNTLIAESTDIVTYDGEHYFPESALKREYTTFSNHRASDARGQAQFLSLFHKGEMLADAVWFYAEPSEAAAQLKGRVAFGKGVQIVE